MKFLEDFQRSVITPTLTTMHLLYVDGVLIFYNASKLHDSVSIETTWKSSLQIIA